MNVELNLGDKVWMHYGPSTLIVGHVIDYSPDYTMIGMSPLPYDEYKEMTLMQRASCPISWCEIRACHYLTHIPYEELKKQEEERKKPTLGFGGFTR